MRRVLLGAAALTIALAAESGAALPALASAHADANTSQPASSAAAMPTPESVGVGPQVALTTMKATSVVAGRSYDAVLVLGRITIAKGRPPTSFTNCRIEGSIVTYSPINLESCTVTGGVYAYDTGGSIESTLIDSRDVQGFRSATERMQNAFLTSTPWVVTNSYLRLGGAVRPNTAAAQIVGGVGLTFANVVFDTAAAPTSSGTADLAIIGKDVVCEDCWFVGSSAFGVVSFGPNNTFVRPRFSTTHPSGLVAPGSSVDTVPTIVDGSYLDGTPVAPIMPTPATVGVSPAVPLTPVDPIDVQPGGTYDRVIVRGSLEIGPDQPLTTFTNCRIEGAILTRSPISFDACTVHGGIYSYDTGGTINRTLLDSTEHQAFRPGTEDAAHMYTSPTPWVVMNSYLRIPQGLPPAHTEAAQVLGGVGIVFRNVVFDTGGPFNNSQTADLSFIGKDLLCEDCWFVGHGGYAIYSDGPNNVFVRPRFGPHHEFGKVFPASGDRIPPLFVDPQHLDGTPIPI